MSTLILSILVASVTSQQSGEMKITATASGEYMIIRLYDLHSPDNRGAKGATVIVRDLAGNILGEPVKTGSSGAVRFRVPEPPANTGFEISAINGPLSGKRIVNWRLPSESSVVLEEPIHRTQLTIRTSKPCTYVTSGYYSCYGCGCSPSCCSSCCWSPPVIPCVPSCCTSCGPIILSQTQGNAERAWLTASLPNDAVVFINGLRTKSTGAHREYASDNLEAGRVYRYEVRAQVVRNGKLIDDTKEVLLKVGERRSLAFDFFGNHNASLAAAIAR